MAELSSRADKQDSTVSQIRKKWAPPMMTDFHSELKNSIVYRFFPYCINDNSKMTHTSTVHVYEIHFFIFQKSEKDILEEIK